MDLRLAGLYVGPDQVMPVASILATVMGFLLIFWGKLLGFFRKILGLGPRHQENKSEPAPGATKPGETPNNK